ncbi:MAG: C39 family peptidase [Candidatus Gracilibacteria bacterium]|jgi:hypothetical protein|nr:C39 family peptidase [Candidatus Gracilibacteria bacterium]
MKKILLTAIILILFSSCQKIDKTKETIVIKKTEIQNKKVIEKIIEDNTTKIITNNSTPFNKEETTEKEPPKKAFIEADFICQAPLQTEANWVFHEESCEEAALLQTYNFEKDLKMTKSEANTEILKMIDWQIDNFNGHHDIYADKIKEMAIKFYSLKDTDIKIIYDAEISDIKKIIASGHPVIAPVTSKYLKNPYYPHPGYHMLQVIGYDENNIITNDNGTRKGANYPYKIEVFDEALKDAGADILYLDIKKAPY